jgi:hypothetical protein
LINDISYSTSKLSFFIYADDTNAIVSHQNLNELITIVNDELGNLSKWFKSNKLSLNIAKTNYMLFKNRHSNLNYQDPDIVIDDISILRVSNTKFLGVIIDECLSWDNHNTYIANIVSKYTGILYRLKNSLPNNALFSLYTTLVLPYLHYCNIIWADSNNSNLSTIHLKQKKIIRLCSNAGWLDHSSPLFSQLGTLTIQDIHKLYKATFMYNFINNNVPTNFNDYFVRNSSIHSYGTRSLDMLRPYAFNTNLAINTIRNHGPKLWNGIRDDIKNSPSTHAFKRNYKQYLLSLY